MEFRRLSSGASGGRAGRCPGAKPRFLGGASELPWISMRIMRLGFESLSFVLASRNAWYSACDASEPPGPKGTIVHFKVRPEILLSMACMKFRLWF
jgi:hypothetical protein